MKKNITMLFIGVCMISIAFANQYYNSYKLIHNDGYDFNATSDYSIEKLRDNDYVISLNFEQVGNRKDHIVSLSIKKIQSFNTVKIKNMIFKTENGEKIVPLNIQFSPIIEKIEFENKEIYVTYIKIANLRLDKLFGKNEKELFNVEIRLQGELDSMDYDEKYIFIAKKYKRQKSAPNWLYRLFPGM
ncbi:hypothetical protein [uncultured Treponema sp.]|uniref:hypothetical protein n=1 Tax=uncultured Treponema sp. TaxID=162155 RepID=UPI00262F0BE5|nr:hypothetical protein [uncultured Treponema sp.]